MDSGNSGSLQSSSGGDDVDVFDSHPPFPPPPPPPPSTTSNPFFDPLPFLDPTFSLLSPPPPRAPPPNPPIIINPNNCTLSPAPTSAPTAARPSKKRSRASRRAPTTVLTTDTSNFRAMVQEFTGIPSPPFPNSTTSSTSSLSSLFSRPRFDFLSTSTSISTNPPPPFLLKPFPQKLPTSLTSLASLPTTSATYANFQNPLLGFGDMNSSNPMNDNPAGLIGSGWAAAASGSDPQAARAGSSCKLNYSAGSGSAEFHADKGSELPGRGEGTMLDSWICSSD